MSIRVVIVEDPMDPRKWEDTLVDDARDFLMERFGSWPASARIYDLEGFEALDRAAGALLTSVLSSRDVTPRDEAGVERLGNMAGPLLVAVSPADPVTAIIAVVAVAVGVAASFLFMPKVPDANNTYQSPNNTLSDRVNTARPNARIPDIFGTVRSTPDLLTVPYKMFDDNLEYEISYMCVGRGAYDIADVRDGDTLITAISGSGVTFYGPGTSPNSGAPQLQIGTAIDEPVVSVTKMNETNGQVLRPPNYGFLKGDNNIRFVYPDQVQRTGDIDFTQYLAADDIVTIGGADFGDQIGSITNTENARYTSAGVIEFESYSPGGDFSPGQSITVSNAGYAGPDDLDATLYVDLSGVYEIASVGPSSITLVSPGDVNSDWDRLSDYPGNRTEYRSASFSVATDTSGYNLNGVYTILSVSSGAVTLSNPALANPAWNNLDDLPGGATEYTSASLSTSGERWVGPFVVDLDNLDRVLLNFVALNGLYTINKKSKQNGVGVDVIVELTPIDSEDLPVGPAETFTTTLYGSADNKDSVGLSLTCSPTFRGRTSVRVRRTSETDPDYEGTLVDEVKWRDGYGLAAVSQGDFGDVTTVHSRTYATAAATSVKDRKLNLRARRRLPAPLGGGNFSTELVGTDRVDDIMSAISLDPYIGNYKPALIDFANIYATVAEVQSYFGSERAVEFGYTFDDDNISFEETLATVADCCFCSAYRQGSLIRISFERARDAGSLLFNHRNVLPRTQQRSRTYGVVDDHDGVELDWTAARDGAVLTYEIPYDRSAVSPRKVEVPGVRSGELAFWHAWRAWYRLKYQSAILEQEATQEAALVLPKDRVSITDLTRPPGFEGEILSVEGLDLELSQPITFADGVAHVIYIQHIDATVEMIPVFPWANAGGEPDDPYMVTLGSAPRLDLATGEDLSVRPVYEIIPATDRRPRAWLVTEREPNTNFTETVRAINYSPMYYMNDELIMWLPFSEVAFRDQSPGLRDPVATGDGVVVGDDQRGKLVYRSAAGTGALNFPLLISPASYTKAAWVRVPATGVGEILSSSAGERLALNNATVEAGHGSIVVSAAIPTTTPWHHVAVTYAEELLVLYVDGIEAARAPGIARGPLAQLEAFYHLATSADDLRLWKRDLSPEEVLSLFRSTRRPSP